MEATAEATTYIASLKLAKKDYDILYKLAGALATVKWARVIELEDAKDAARQLRHKPIIVIPKAETITRKPLVEENADN